MTEDKIRELEQRIERLENMVETLSKGLSISVNTQGLDAKQRTLFPPKQKRLFE
tara:strand:+ start:35 stop:196 length:162 start_codon:yes stop_codon:yes gene_type:complete